MSFALLFPSRQPQVLLHLVSRHLGFLQPVASPPPSCQPPSWVPPATSILSASILGSSSRSQVLLHLVSRHHGFLQPMFSLILGHSVLTSVVVGIAGARTSDILRRYLPLQHVTSLPPSCYTCFSLLTIFESQVCHSNEQIQCEIVSRCIGPLADWAKSLQT